MASVYEGRISSCGGLTPPLKWAGGKQWLAPLLVEVARSGHRYFEPFLGGGALFFAATPSRSFLSDINGPLIETYQALREEPEKVVSAISRLQLSEDEYYRVRSMTPRTRAGRAARLLYLNRTCWNGLYRVNKKGAFNVPCGDLSRALRLSMPHLSAVAQSLRRATLTECDFEAAVDRAKPGDVVYFDPPYTTAHDNNGFIRYNEQLFSWADQERLSHVARRLSARQVRVVISNACFRQIFSLYEGFFVRRIERPSNLAARSKSRGRAVELLIASVPLRGLSRLNR